MEILGFSKEWVILYFLMIAGVTIICMAFRQQSGGLSPTTFEVQDVKMEIQNIKNYIGATDENLIEGVTLCDNLKSITRNIGNIEFD